VGTISANATLPKCYNGDGSSPSYSTSNVFCSFIQRDSNGQLNNIAATSANLGSYDTAGIDIQADWYVDLDALGIGKSQSRLLFNTVVSYLDSFEIQNFEGAPTVDYAGSIAASPATPSLAGALSPASPIRRRPSMWVCSGGTSVI